MNEIKAVNLPETTREVTSKNCLDYYDVMWWCSNCGKKNIIYIKKGLTIKQIETDICENCGCKNNLIKVAIK